MKLPHKFIAIVLLSGIFFAPLSWMAEERAFERQQAEAASLGALGQGFIAGVAGCAAAAAILNVLGHVYGLAGTSVPSKEGAGDLKDQIIDCIVYNVINTLIEDMLNSLTEWVQGGFKGNPVFSTRLNKEIEDVGRDVAKKVISEKVPFLCSPFRVQIQLQLIKVYRDDRQLEYIHCNFEENIQKAFLGGDFSSGGWDSWIKTVTDPSNNPYGSYLETEDLLALQISGAQDEYNKKIIQGNGFLSKEVKTCYEFPADGQDGPPQQLPPDFEGPPAPGTEIKCDTKTVTPGSFVQDQLAKQYGIPADRLSFADELNEMINAVITYLIKNMLQGDKGLAGYDKDDFDNTFPPLPTVDDPGIGGDDSTPGDSEPAGPPGKTMCFEKKGVFLVPEQGGIETAGFQFNVPANVSYDSVEISVDVKNNGWWPDREGWPVMPFWFVRDGNKNMFGYVKINAPGGNSGRGLMLAHGIGLSHAYKTRVRSKTDFPEGATYRFKEVYDAKNKKITLTVTNLGTGKVVKTLSSTPTVPGINSGNEKFRIGIGYSSTEAGPRERPAYGWEHSNLKVSFISSNGTLGDCDTPSPWGSKNDKPNDPPDGGSGGDDDPPLAP